MNPISLQCVYSLILRNRTPIVNPGETVNIEVYLSGYGIPEKNKLDIKWSSPYVVHDKNPGTVTYCIKLATDKTTGKSQPVTGNQFLESLNLESVGIDAILNQGFFFNNPTVAEVDKSGFCPVVSENQWDKNPPLLLSLNTARNALSGDYDITFTFTYGSEQNIHQDYKLTQFHITSRWERNQAWITISATIVAFLALIATAIGSVWQIKHW